MESVTTLKAERRMAEAGLAAGVCLPALDAACSWIRMKRYLAILAVGVTLANARAGAVVYTAQSRAVSVLTTVDAGAASASAPDFAPFVASVERAVQFVGAGGVIRVNHAFAGIDCELDPNRLRLLGQFAGSGGLSVAPDGAEVQEFGQGRITADIDFEVGTRVMMTIAAPARPVSGAGDTYKVRLRGPGGGPAGALVEIDETMPPEPLERTISLEPGAYSLAYEVQHTATGDPTTASPGLILLFRSPDLDSDGVVGTADLVRFLGRFGQSAGVWDEAAACDLNADGVVDSADLVTLIGRFGGV